MLRSLLVFVSLLQFNTASAKFVCPTPKNLDLKTDRGNINRIYKALKTGSSWGRYDADNDWGMGIIDKKHLTSIEHVDPKKKTNAKVFGAGTIPAVQQQLDSYEHDKGIFKIFYYFGVKTDTSSEYATECPRQIVIEKSNGRGDGHYEGWLYVDVCNPGVLLGSVGKGPIPGKLGTPTLVPEQLEHFNPSMALTDEQIDSGLVGYVKDPATGDSIFRAKAKIEDLYFHEDANGCTMEIDMDDKVDGFAGIISGYTFQNFYGESYEHPTYFWNGKGKRESTLHYGLIYTNADNQPK
ncbi:MAG: hypothetical protein AAF203_11450 [Pseudomonadota bacterium]